jgi:hypothetical protein
MLDGNLTASSQMSEVVLLAVEFRRRFDAGSGGILLGRCDSSDGLVKRDAEGG